MPLFVDIKQTPVAFVTQASVPEGWRLCDASLTEWMAAHLQRRLAVRKTLSHDELQVLGASILKYYAVRDAAMLEAWFDFKPD